MANIKNIVITGIATATTAVCTGIIIKHLCTKKAAEEKTQQDNVKAEAGAVSRAYITLHKRANDVADVLIDIQDQAWSIGTEVRVAISTMDIADEHKLAQWKGNLKKLRERMDSLSDEERKAVNEVYPKFIGYTENRLKLADYWIGKVEEKGKEA